MDNIFEIMRESYNHENSIAMSKYMRNLFPFIGLKTPKRKEITKEFIKEKKKEKQVDWEFVRECYAQKEREFHYLALDHIDSLAKTLQVEDVERLKELALKNSWWDTIDRIDRLVGSIALRHEEVNETLIKWSKDENIWLRRIAIDHQLPRKDKTNSKLLEEIIINNLGSDEFFINKAIGWSLREYSKTNPQWAKNFLENHSQKMAKLSIKEAQKKIVKNV